MILRLTPEAAKDKAAKSKIGSLTSFDWSASVTYGGLSKFHLTHEMGCLSCLLFLWRHIIRICLETSYYSVVFLLKEDPIVGGLYCHASLNLFLIKKIIFGLAFALSLESQQFGETVTSCYLYDPGQVLVCLLGKNLTSTSEWC